MMSQILISAITSGQCFIQQSIGGDKFSFKPKLDDLFYVKIGPQLLKFFRLTKLRNLQNTDKAVLIVMVAGSTLNSWSILGIILRDRQQDNYSRSLECLWGVFSLASMVENERSSLGRENCMNPDGAKQRTSTYEVRSQSFDRLGHGYSVRDHTVAYMQ